MLSQNATTRNSLLQVSRVIAVLAKSENLYIMSAFIISKDRHLSKIAKEFLQVHGIEVS